MKKLLLIFLFSLGLLGASYSQCGCTKIVFIVDNSGSVSTTEFTQMKRSIDSIATQLLRLYPGSELSVLQYASQGSGSHKYHVSVPFTTSAATARTWGRAYGTGGSVATYFQDHLPGSMYQMRKDSIWFAGNTVDLQTNACNIRMFLFTDALSGSTGSGCCSHLSSVSPTVAPLAMVNFGEYNWHKTTFGSEWTVYHVNSSATNRAAGAAIASKGGSYTGIIAANPGDPQGSGGPRKLWWSTTFTLSQPDVDSALANINAGSFSASFPNDTICLGDSAHFNSNIMFPTSVLKWTFGDATGDSNILNPAHIYTAPGTYQVTLVAWSADSTCKDTISKPVVIVPTLVADFWADTACLRSATTFTNTTAGFLGSVIWDFGDGTGSTFNPDTSHIYMAAGNYSVELKVRSSNMCADSITKNVVVEDCPISNFTFVNTCQYLTVNYTNTTITTSGSFTGISWEWDFGNGQTSNLQDPSMSYNLPGAYLVQLISTTSFGCVDTTQDTILIYPKPVASFFSDTACLTHPTTFTDNSTVIVGSIVGWGWNTSGSPITQNTITTFPTPGTFSITHNVTSNFGCVDDTTIPIIVRPLPIPNFTFSPSDIFIFDTKVCFNNSSTGAINYFWDFKFTGIDGTSTTLSPCLVTFPNTNEGTYHVKLIAENQYGCTDSIFKDVIILDGFIVYAPNSFTPNEDGKNDVFSVYTEGIVEYELFIFNRWGEKIFHTTDRTKSWDGKISGGEYYKNDTYVYKIIVKSKNNETKEFHGHINLIR